MTDSRHDVPLDLAEARLVDGIVQLASALVQLQRAEATGEDVRACDPRGFRLVVDDLAGCALLTLRHPDGRDVEVCGWPLDGVQTILLAASGTQPGH